MSMKYDENGMTRNNTKLKKSKINIIKKKVCLLLTI